MGATQAAEQLLRIVVLSAALLAIHHPIKPPEKFDHRHQYDHAEENQAWVELGMIDAKIATHIPPAVALREKHRKSKTVLHVKTPAAGARLSRVLPPARVPA